MPEDLLKRITIHDVARIADVSYQTVSRVINHSPNVSEKTRQSVLRVMKELNYQPNKAAQMLNTNRSFTLEAMIVDVQYGGNLAKTTQKMVRTAKELGYSLLVSETDAKGLAQALENAASRLIDGVIIYAPNLNIDDQDLLDMSHGIPFVRRDYVPNSKLAWVGFDQPYAAQVASDFLIEMGHTQIVEISPPRDFHNGHWRHEALVEALNQHGIPLQGTFSGDYTIQSGYDGAVELLDSGFPFTAVVAGTDKMAMGAIHAFRERGLRIPEDISIIGFDNAEIAAFTYPPLTTVEFKFDKQDELAVKYLIDLIKDPEMELHHRILTPSLVIRESVRQL